MIHFTANHCELRTTIPSLKQFVNDVHYKFYKKDRGHREDRNPHLKVTDDIFSVCLWVRTQKGVEQRIFLDGDVFLNQLVIHTITIESEKFDIDMYNIIKKTLLDLTKLAKGVLYVETDFAPARFENGEITPYRELLTELYEALSEEEKDKFNDLYQALYDGFSSN